MKCIKELKYMKKDLHEYYEWMSPSELYAYIAGLFDGEGHVIAYRATSADNLPYVKAGITNTVRLPLAIVQKEFGGRITEKQRSGNRKLCYEWVCSTKNEVSNFLMAIEPFLFIKKKKVKAALRILKILLTHDVHKLGLNSLLIIEYAMWIFGDKLYIDNPERYQKTCQICGDIFKRSKDRGKTCSIECREILKKRNADAKKT